MTKKWDYVIPDEQFEGLIKNYCNDFTAQVRAGRHDPITGRDKEILDCILVLLQKGRKNVCFLAPAGVGKTAAVIGLAQKIVSGDVPDYVKNARVLEIDLARMASGTASRAEFQDRFLPLCKGVSERYHNPDLPRIIIFLDEIHQIMPNCVGSSYAGLSDTMKPYLTAGDLLVIGATTLDEYRLYIALDDALDRRFQKIFLKVPTVNETYSIMKNLRPGLEKHHKTTISNDLLMLIVRLTEEHMRKRNQPDKSIITTDAAMAYHVLNHGTGHELTPDSIYYMMARETSLNANAMHDKQLINEIAKNVKDIESGDYQVQQENKKPQKVFNPNELADKIKKNEQRQGEDDSVNEEAKAAVAEARLKAEKEKTFLNK